jgi:hypothetical protein
MSDFWLHLHLGIPDIHILCTPKPTTSVSASEYHKQTLSEADPETETAFEEGTNELVKDESFFLDCLSSPSSPNKHSNRFTDIFTDIFTDTDVSSIHPLQQYIDCCQERLVPLLSSPYLEASISTLNQGPFNSSTYYSQNSSKHSQNQPNQPNQQNNNDVFLSLILESLPVVEVKLSKLQDLLCILFDTHINTFSSHHAQSHIDAHAQTAPSIYHDEENESFGEDVEIVLMSSSVCKLCIPNHETPQDAGSLNSQDTLRILDDRSLNGGDNSNSRDRINGNNDKDEEVVQTILDRVRHHLKNGISASSKPIIIQHTKNMNIRIIINTHPFLPHQQYYHDTQTATSFILSDTSPSNLNQLTSHLLHRLESHTLPHLTHTLLTSWPPETLTNPFKVYYSLLHSFRISLDSLLSCSDGLHGLQGLWAGYRDGLVVSLQQINSSSSSSTSTSSSLVLSRDPPHPPHLNAHQNHQNIIWECWNYHTESYLRALVAYLMDMACPLIHRLYGFHPPYKAHQTFVTFPLPVQKFYFTSHNPTLFKMFILKYLRLTIPPCSKI